jgi:hypothetical protein
MIAFDFARTFNPSSRMGTATGIVNIGGFAASLIAMFGIGVILDLLYAWGLSGDDLYALGSFRTAMAFQLVILGAGAAAILIVRRTVRRQMAEQGVIVPPLREALAREQARRRTARTEGSDGATSA